MGDGLSRRFGSRGYPEVRVKRSLKNFDDQKALAIGEPSQIGIELGADLDVDLFNPSGAPTERPSGYLAPPNASAGPAGRRWSVVERTRDFL